MQSFKIEGLFVGRAKEIGPNRFVTAIAKDPVVDKLIIKCDSLEGDESHNLKFHGGPDRVIHHYSLEQYEYLKSVFPQHKELFVPGSYGENITTDKLTEKDLCIGDIFKLGSSTLQLTEGRKPCGTIDIKYGFKGVLKEIVRSGRYGWFYKVLEEGEASLSDELVFVDRPYPSFSLDKSIYEIFQNKKKDLKFLIELSNCPALSSRWKERILKLT